MSYHIEEVDGSDPNVAEILHRFNGYAPETFPALTSNHLEHGYWWLAYDDQEVVAFAGMVPNDPYDILGVGYLKRCFVMPEARRRGLQLLLLTTREVKARELGWKMLVSECAGENHASAASFARAGFARTDPEQKWGEPGSLYWFKIL